MQAPGLIANFLPSPWTQTPLPEPADLPLSPLSMRRQGGEICPTTAVMPPMPRRACSTALPLCWVA
jgi:hypothetical protein